MAQNLPFVSVPLKLQVYQLKTSLVLNLVFVVVVVVNGLVIFFEDSLNTISFFQEIMCDQQDPGE